MKNKIDEKNIARFQSFLENLHRLEIMHNIYIGEVFHDEDGPDEIEIWSGRAHGPFYVDRYYGTYSVAKRPRKD